MIWSLPIILMPLFLLCTEILIHVWSIQFGRLLFQFSLQLVCSPNGSLHVMARRSWAHIGSNTAWMPARTLVDDNLSDYGPIFFNIVGFFRVIRQWPLFPDCNLDSKGWILIRLMRVFREIYSYRGIYIFQNASEVYTSVVLSWKNAAWSTYHL